MPPGPPNSAARSRMSCGGKGKPGWRGPSEKPSRPLGEGVDSGPLRSRSRLFFERPRRLLSNPLAAQKEKTSWYWETVTWM